MRQGRKENRGRGAAGTHFPVGRLSRAVRALAFANKTPMTTDVPFRLLGGAQPLAVVSTHLNGYGPFAFALDTGAAAPVLAPDLVQRLGIQLDQTKEAMGAG